MNVSKRRFLFRSKTVFVCVHESHLTMRRKSEPEKEAVFHFSELAKTSFLGGVSEQVELPLFAEMFQGGEGI